MASHYDLVRRLDPAAGSWRLVGLVDRAHARCTCAGRSLHALQGGDPARFAGDRLARPRSGGLKRCPLPDSGDLLERIESGAGRAGRDGRRAQPPRARRGGVGGRRAGDDRGQRRGAIERELAARGPLTGRPIAVNLLLPVRAARLVRGGGQRPTSSSTFWGRPKRRTPGVWMHQCGSVAEARAAHAAGADARDRPGRRGGRARAGSDPRARAARARAGGAAARLPAAARRRQSPRRARRSSGARRGRDGAAVAGTRFLLSEESRAHPDYRRRLIEAEETDPHRAVRRRLAGSAPRRSQRGDGAHRARGRSARPAR